MTKLRTVFRKKKKIVLNLSKIKKIRKLFKSSKNHQETDNIIADEMINSEEVEEYLQKILEDDRKKMKKNADIRADTK